MKKIVLLLIAAAAVSSCSKEEFHIYEDVSSILYFTNGGFHDLTGLYAESPLFEAEVYRSGTLTESVNVGIGLKKTALLDFNLRNGENRKLLPENCYSLETVLKTLSGKGRLTGFTIGLDADNIGALAPGEYVLPIGISSPDASVKSEYNTILLGFDIN